MKFHSKLRFLHLQIPDLTTFSNTSQWPIVLGTFSHFQNFQLKFPRFPLLMNDSFDSLLLKCLQWFSMKFVKYSLTTKPSQSSIKKAFNYSSQFYLIWILPVVSFLQHLKNVLMWTICNILINSPRDCFCSFTKQIHLSKNLLFFAWQAKIKN
jgi:hypothetical protein